MQEKVAAAWNTVGMRIFICGVRGSTPTPGLEFDRYGGHTSCLAIAHDRERPSLIVDAGTGIRLASDLFGGSPGLFDGQPYHGAIILGHLHWDHTQGLPFFAGADRPDARTDLYMPEQGDAEEVLRRVMSPPHFPITPAQLRGTWTFRGLEADVAHDIEGFTVVAREIPHKGGRTFGFRVSDDTATLAYLSDHCPTALGPGPDGLGEYHDTALALVADADLLIHDAQYLDDELARRASFGHSSPGYAAHLAQRAGAARLVLFHHDPPRTDDDIDAVVASFAGGSLAVVAAAEGMVLDLPASPPS